MTSRQFRAAEKREKDRKVTVTRATIRRTSKQHNNGLVDSAPLSFCTSMQEIHNDVDNFSEQVFTWPTQKGRFIAGNVPKSTLCMQAGQKYKVLTFAHVCTTSVALVRTESAGTQAHRLPWPSRRPGHDDHRRDGRIFVASVCSEVSRQLQWGCLLASL